MLEKLLSLVRTNRSQASECSTAFRRVGVLLITDQSIEASFDPLLLVRANLFAALCGVVAVTLVNGPHSFGAGVSSCAVITLTLFAITFSMAGRIRTGFSLGK